MLVEENSRLGVCGPHGHGSTFRFRALILRKLRNPSGIREQCLRELRPYRPACAGHHGRSGTIARARPGRLHTVLPELRRRGTVGAGAHLQPLWRVTPVRAALPDHRPPLLRLRPRTHSTPGNRQCGWPAVHGLRRLRLASCGILSRLRPLRRPPEHWRGVHGVLDQAGCFRG